MDTFAPTSGVVTIHPPPPPGTREAADLAALCRAGRDLESHLAACERAAPVPDLATILAARAADASQAAVAAQAVGLALSATRLALDLVRARMSSPDTSAE